MCADILIDINNPGRLSCCEQVTLLLLSLFPDAKDRPEVVVQWLKEYLEKIEDSGVVEKTSPLFTRDGTYKTLAALTEAAKQKVHESMPPHSL